MKTAAKVNTPPPPPIELSLPGNYEILSKFSYHEPLSINPNNLFLSVESSGASLEDRTFEFSQLSDGKSVSIKHVKSGKYMAMKTKSERESWTVKPDCLTPETTSSCQWEIHENKYIYNKYMRAYMNVVKHVHIRGHREEGDSYGPAGKVRMGPRCYAAEGTLILNSPTAAIPAADRSLASP